MEARYNPKFIVTKKEAEILIIKVKQLLELTKSLCEIRIAEYDELVNSTSKTKTKHYIIPKEHIQVADPDLNYSYKKGEKDKEKTTSDQQ